MMIKLGLVVALLCGLAASHRFSYDSYKVYEVVPQNQFESDYLHGLSQMPDGYDFWSLTRLPREPAQVMVSPSHQKQFEIGLNTNRINFKVLFSDFSRSVERERMENVMLRSLNPRVGFTQYHRHDEINNYLDSLAKEYPDLVTVEEAGKSHEGRSMKIIKISNGVKKADKKVVFLDAGIHAREWIAPAGALYVIHQLVEQSGKNKDLLENLDWIILPVVNPDGYEYSHKSQRMWRKSRVPNSSCVGTDGNRNFDFHWGEVGASANGCSDTFRGAKAFSDPETQAVRDILLQHKGVCKFYLTLHSYGNYLLYPWGWTSALPDTWKDLDEVAQAGAAAIKSATGTSYRVGSSTNVLYAAAGGSDDYAFAEAEVPISITMELPGGGIYGFDPSPSKIKDMVAETWVGIRAMALKVAEKY